MKKGNSYEDNNSGEPLCVFCLSPPFLTQRFSSEKRHSAPSRRQELPFSTSSLSGLQLGRIHRKKSYTNLRLTIADLFNNFKRRKSLNLEEILSTIQDVWKGPENLTSTHYKVNTEMISKKLSVQEVCPPNPQRRRLSVPETIMRKHILAQERSNSQESRYYQWANDAQCSSDPNLHKKKDCNLIRKSTLLRRLWGDNNKPKLISGSFQEWQHSYKKVSSTQSLSSNHSSPEHKPKSTQETTSPRRKLSSSPNRFLATKMTDDESASNSPKRKMTIIDNTSLKSLTKTPLSRESTTKYSYSSFTNFSDTNSDSAYTNSISNCTNTVSSTSKNSKNYYNENNHRISEDEGKLSTVSLQEKALQTRNVANLNVISNVNLSQSTLDMIFKEVMKDVSNLTPGEINISSAVVTCDDKNEVMVKNVPNFSLNMNSDCTQLSSSERLNQEQFIIGNIRTGSPYAKPTESAPSAVPRFSAVPQTSSMEVNTSEEDKEESDTTSFVDSLEDFSSPRALGVTRKSFSDISQLLPEGKKYSSPKKSSAFYIPIEVATDKKVKAVSEFLPLKVKEKLIERQQQREEKCRQFKCASALKITDSVNEIKNNLSLKTCLPKKRTKPVLPSIESLKTSTKEKKVEYTKSSSTGKKSSRGSKAREQRDQNINLVYKLVDKKDEFLLEPRKIYRRTTHENAQKRIEILEIMECIEIPPERGQKSKIPLPVSSSKNKKVNLNKPSYLDLDEYVPEQKLDQLIANILIDTLNHDVDSANYDGDKKNANFSEPMIGGNDEKYVQKFDSIPEETPIRRRHLEENNNHDEIVRGPNENYSRLVKNKKLEKKNVSSIPKGWVTVHTIHKDTETPESTSDEGKQYLDTNDVKEAIQPSVNVDATTAALENHDSSKSILTKSDSKAEYLNDQLLTSSNDENSLFESTLLNRPLRKFGNYMRKAKIKREKQQQKTQEDWSVTVSGTNSYGQMAPNVEMRLKFPNKFIQPFHQNYSETNPQEKRPYERELNFPKIENDRNSRETQTKVQRQKSIDGCLPKIQTSQNKNRKIDGSVISVTPSIIVPRQTKTSRSRYHLSRPREGFSLPDVPSILNERQYYEILRQIPGILAVTGRSISSEGKSFEER